MKILIAPDKFKGSISAHQVARILEDEINSILPTAIVTQIPLADGGDGSLEVICNNGYQVQSVSAPNAVGEISKCSYGISSDGQDAFIELAQVCGIASLSSKQRNPWLTSTKGLGVVIRDAIERGITSLTLSIGGSASIDGGAGLLEGLGARLIDKDGNEISGTLANLDKVVSIDYGIVDQILSKVKLNILTDVTNPLVGEDGAAAIFGLQKGLSLSEVSKVDSALTHWASILLRKNHSSLLTEPGLGAAGGVALPLCARYSISIVRGSDFFFEQFKVGYFIESSDLVITGEGSFDSQSFMGKIVGKVLECANSFNKPNYVIAGVVSGIDDSSIFVISLSDLAGNSADSMRDPERYLRKAVNKIFASYQIA